MKTHGGARQGAGRKKLAPNHKKTTVALRVSPACKDWLKDKAMELDCSMGAMVELMMNLWREQERKYYGVDDSDEPYIAAFCTSFNKKMAVVTKEITQLPLSEQLVVAEKMREMAMAIRYGSKEDGK